MPKTSYVKLLGAYRPQWAKRYDNGLHNFKNLQKQTVECMMGVLRKNLDQGWVYSRPSFRGGVEGVRYFWTGAALILTCQTNS